MRLRITIDAFSGIPNPSWEIDDPDQVSELLELFARNRAALAEKWTGYTGLGFRGLRVDIIGDIEFPGLPQSFEVAGGGAQDPFTSATLADRLVATMPSGPQTGEAFAAGEEWSEEFRQAVREEIQRTVTRARLDGAAQAESQEGPPPNSMLMVEPEAGGQLLTLAGSSECPYDVLPFIPGYWNRPEIQLKNNCYNYAVCRRTDDYAQPGYAHGYVIPTLTKTCFEVTQGVLLDGLRKYPDDCQPPESLRFLIAMVRGVTRLGPDFHFYRLHSEGFWGHKMGDGPARNTCDAQPGSHVITDPKVCCDQGHGRYTEWCGYFQSRHSVQISGFKHVR